MATEITIEPGELGSAIITISPTDEDNVALSLPDFITAQWQLVRYNRGPVIINNRSFENSTMTSLEVVLTGNDLELFTSREDNKRYFTFKGEYYSSSLDTNLNLVAEASFYIEDFVGITNTLGG